MMATPKMLASRMLASKKVRCCSRTPVVQAFQEKVRHPSSSRGAARRVASDRVLHSIARCRLRALPFRVSSRASSSACNRTWGERSFRAQRLAPMGPQMMRTGLDPTAREEVSVWGEAWKHHVTTLGCEGAEARISPSEAFEAKYGKGAYRLARPGEVVSHVIGCGPRVVPHRPDAVLGPVGPYSPEWGGFTDGIQRPHTDRDSIH